MVARDWTGDAGHRRALALALALALRGRPPGPRGRGVAMLPSFMLPLVSGYSGVGDWREGGIRSVAIERGACARVEKRKWPAVLW